MDKVLSIIIPSYNVAKYLPEVLPSYLNSSCIEEFELLIVNDGSKDNTAEVAEGYRVQYPDTIRIINKENGGHGSTINAGIKQAQGRYTKVIDGDDWVDTAAFERFVGKLKNTGADIILSPFNKVDEASRQISGRVTYPGLMENVIYDLHVPLGLAKERNYAMHSLTFKTSVLKQIPPISEHCFYVDMEYVIYPLPFVSTVGYIDEAVYQYRVGSAGQSMALQNMIKNRMMHQHVIRQLEQYYAESENELVKEIIAAQLKGLYDTQINIYCMMPATAENRRELKSFIRETKASYPELCADPDGIKTKILFMGGGLGYGLISFAYRMIKNRKQQA